MPRPHTWLPTAADRWLCAFNLLEACLAAVVAVSVGESSVEVCVHKGQCGLRLLWLGEQRRSRREGKEGGAGKEEPRENESASEREGRIQGSFSRIISAILPNCGSLIHPWQRKHEAPVGLRELTHLSTPVPTPLDSQH